MIELLVALAVIGLLVAVLLPAVQMAREVARRMQCSNHLKQNALAALLHHDANRHLPSGGWGKHWAGLPGLGFGAEQPGGWAFNILPYIEQQALADMGGTTPGDLAANGVRLQSGLATMHCPSRRDQTPSENALMWQPPYHPLVDRLSRGDYAMNGGDQPMAYGTGPLTLADAPTFAWPDMTLASGVCFQRSKVRLSEINDGSSHTYLVAEKHLRRDRYFNGMDKGDNESLFSGDDRDLIRFTGFGLFPPMQPRNDQFTVSQEGLVFGSAHVAGFQTALCDGSVRMVAYEIDPQVHSRLGNRHDGQPVELP